MFRRWKYPPRRLELMDLSQSLDPGVVDDIALGNAIPVIGGGEWDVSVDRIMDQAIAMKLAHGEIMSVSTDCPKPPRLVAYGPETAIRVTCGSCPACVVPGDGGF